MKPSEALQAHREEALAVIGRHGAGNPRFFGSTARGEDTEASDLDILVDAIPGKTTLLSLAAIARDLEALLGVPVDVVTPDVLHDRFCVQVLAEAKPI